MLLAPNWDLSTLGEGKEGLDWEVGEGGMGEPV